MNNQPRLKSSFIYLANAVRDLSDNWQLFTAVLAPLVFAASLCLLPDALNLQHQLVRTFEPGVHSVSLHEVSLTPIQQPYVQARPTALPLYPKWETRTLHILFLVFGLFNNLIVLCALRDLQLNGPGGTIGSRFISIYKHAFQLTPPFAWVTLLQVIATLIGIVLLIIPGLLAFIWLYFTQYALVMDDRRSWPALIYSRDLMRRRFFPVAIRIVVFLAVWSGFNSWAAGAFFAISLFLNIVGAITGFLWAGVFMADLIAVAVAFATTSFFYAAGVRLYQDLNAIVTHTVAATELEPPPTAPLPSAALQV